MSCSLREILLKRRSVRQFSDDPVDEAQIERLAEALVWAPSAGNMQPWRFLFIKNAGIRKALARAAWNQSFIEEAPLVIAVCAYPEESASRYGSRGSEFYCLMDCAAAIQNMLLTAADLGLGACWVGAFNDEEVARVLETGEELRPVAIIPIGHPSGNPGRSSRRATSEVVRHIE